MSSLKPTAGPFPRIEEHAFIGVIFTFLAIAIIAAAARTFLRIQRSGHLEIDDAFLVLAIITLAASEGVIYKARDLLYLQIYVSLGVEPPEEGYAEKMLYYHKLNNIGSVLVWTSIFAVKFSFVFFFRKLIRRVRTIEIWWWIVVLILVPSACICIPLGFFICPDFSMNFLTSCPATLIVHREGIYLDVTVCLDILTDVLVISVPLLLLWKVRIDLRRKLAIGAVLCLSVFMVVIAIVRVTLAPLPRGVTDSVWLFFWQVMEATTAVLMVSLTALRSAFGQENKASKCTPVYVNKANSRGEYTGELKTFVPLRSKSDEEAGHEVIDGQIRVTHQR